MRRRSASPEPLSISRRPNPTPIGSTAMYRATAHTTITPSSSVLFPQQTSATTRRSKPVMELDKENAPTRGGAVVKNTSSTLRSRQGALTPTRGNQQLAQTQQLAPKPTSRQRSPSAASVKRNAPASSLLGSHYPAARHVRQEESIAQRTSSTATTHRRPSPQPRHYEVRHRHTSDAASRSPLISVSPSSTIHEPSIPQCARSTSTVDKQNVWRDRVFVVEVALLRTEEELHRQSIEKRHEAHISTLHDELKNSIRSASARRELDTTRKMAAALMLTLFADRCSELFEACVEKGTVLKNQLTHCVETYDATTQAMDDAVIAEDFGRSAIEESEKEEHRFLVDKKVQVLRQFWATKGPAMGMRLLPSSCALPYRSANRGFGSHLISSSGSRSRSVHNEEAEETGSNHPPVRKLLAAGATHPPTTSVLPDEEHRLLQQIQALEAKHCAETRRILTQLVRREEDLRDARKQIHLLSGQCNELRRNAERPPLAGEVRRNISEDQHELVRMRSEQSKLVKLLADAQDEVRRLGEERDAGAGKIQSLLMAQAKSAKTIQLLEQAMKAKQ